MPSKGKYEQFLQIGKRQKDVIRKDLRGWHREEPGQIKTLVVIHAHAEKLKHNDVQYPKRRQRWEKRGTGGFDQFHLAQVSTERRVSISIHSVGQRALWKNEHSGVQRRQIDKCWGKGCEVNFQIGDRSMIWREID